MSGHNNFQTKNMKNTNDRTDIYESSFETPIKPSEDNSNTIKRNIEKR